MKTHCTLALLAVAWTAVTISTAFGQGTPIVQHVGTNDPTTEGFNFSTYPELLGPVVNDQGMNAWMIHSTNGYVADYSFLLTPQQQSEVTGVDWSLSTTLRLIQSGPIGVELVAGSEGGFFLNFDINSNGDPTVQAGASNPVFVLTGAGSTYNNFQLRYDAAEDTASLWVNGIQEVSGITGDLDYAGSAWGLFWGSFQGPPSQANWNLVSLSNIPEPSATCLFFLGLAGAASLKVVRCGKQRTRRVMKEL